jgi:hypothetical protein
VGTAISWFMVGCAGLGLSIILVNRPSLFVPPPMRRDRGAVQEWLHKRRRRPTNNQ